MDVDSTPVLSFLSVEGSLIFPPDADPNHMRTFDAHYILVQGGYLEIGTEEYRYTSKLNITMHSTKYDPNLPIFGNKVIGVHYGTLEMHGVERKITWSDLKTTAEAGATEITLNDVTGDALDWAVGEEIVIASTDFSGRNAEQRTILTITNTDTNPVITFTEPLLHKHYGDIQYFGVEGTANYDFIEMRAEVGLLTRNVKYQGDDTSEEFQYGAAVEDSADDNDSRVKSEDSKSGKEGWHCTVCDSNYSLYTKERYGISHFHLGHQAKEREMERCKGATCVICSANEVVKLEGKFGSAIGKNIPGVADLKIRHIGSHFRHIGNHFRHIGSFFNQLVLFTVANGKLRPKVPCAHCKTPKAYKSISGHEARCKDNPNKRVGSVTSAVVNDESDAEDLSMLVDHERVSALVS